MTNVTTRRLYKRTHQTVTVSILGQYDIHIRYRCATASAYNQYIFYIKCAPKSTVNCWNAVFWICLRWSSLWYWNLWQHNTHAYHTYLSKLEYLTMKYCGSYKRDQSIPIPQTCASFMTPCHYHCCTIIRYCFYYTNLSTTPINYFLFSVLFYTKPINSSLWYCNMHLLAPNTTYGKRLIKYEGSQFWNNLPKTLKSVQSTDAFKTGLRDYLLLNIS